jgi:hypothetical protein
MKIRKIQYNVYYSHILSFKEEYKKIVSPYFGWENVQYAIENLNSLNESIRLIFTDYNALIQCRKDGLSLMYEGDIDDLIKDSGLIHDFFTILENISKVPCFSKMSRHDAIVHAVDTSKKVNVADFISKNPIKVPLIDFAVTYHYLWKGTDIHVTTGDFINADIAKYDLTPFKTKFNEDLAKAETGEMCEIRTSTKENSLNFTKFKSLLGMIDYNLNLFK